MADESSPSPCRQHKGTDISAHSVTYHKLIKIYYLVHTLAVIRLVVLYQVKFGETSHSGATPANQALASASGAFGYVCQVSGESGVNSASYASRTSN